jgi:tryptophan halogenase
MSGAAAELGRFARPGPDARLPLSQLAYAFHFDASHYARFLRRRAEANGVTRTEGKIADVTLDGDSGHVRSVTLDDGRTVEGELFIDCSGFRGLLIEEKLGSGYEDWSRWLPCDRAVAVPTSLAGPPDPFTRSTAREAGWQWRIPLQHRTGNGYVFCDSYLSEDEASRLLLERLDGKPLADPKILRFTAGKRRLGWVKNCLAVGLSSGFLEPLESTSIHLIQIAIMKLFEFFPQRDVNPVLIDLYNREMDVLYDHVRDFIIGHYKVTDRDDTPYWRYCRSMTVPDSLAEKLELFSDRGETRWMPSDLFGETSWFAVLYGQGLIPRSYHPVANALSEDELELAVAGIRTAIRRRVDALPSHADFIEGCCAARPSATAA